MSLSPYLEFIAVYGVGGAHPGGLPLTKRILQNESFNSSHVVLDAGCGTGQTAAYIAKETHAKVMAIDINEEMVKKAKKRFHSLSLSIPVQTADLLSLPYDNDLFDYIILESVLSFTDTKKALCECYRVLKENGVLICTEMTLKRSITNKAKQELENFYGFTNFLTTKEWLQLLSSIFVDAKSINVPLMEHEKNENIPEFHLSDSVPPNLIHALDQHQAYLEAYKHILDFSVFRCKKQKV
ncbi:class I SAM-dependent methyltransferase [Bacillus sp. HMF5848]|uniref:class I SAM-dependent methyltransferase n=1 Tax=Bacillus sp. HMF5848 TaxID=2495421 RepID=UPI000F76CAD0|nr:class I SAM-dependent methyltransferase [Bacillus sp. HMF5848]RSK27267.1 class I SAM-dependent methyltransferase [Bacillus sp. HMF5848]